MFQTDSTVDVPLRSTQTSGPSRSISTLYRKVHKGTAHISCENAEELQVKT